MTTTINKEQKNPNVPNKQEQNQTCLDSAEREGLHPKGNVPNVRFLEFEGEWEKMRLDAFTKRVMRKNKSNQSRLPLTISAQYGLVDQITFFNKVVASTDLSNYYLLKKGEFAYNKSYSSDYPWGAIKRLDNYDQGTLSSLYICFAPQDNVISDFILQYFESPKWHKGISEIAVEGARNHGLLNVSVQDFFHTYHYVPKDKKEQIKISKLLMLLDERIATQDKIIDKLQSLIKGIRHDIFNDIQGEVLALSNIADIYQPQTISSSDLTTEGYWVYGANGIIGKYKEYNHETEQICITCRGNTCGTVNYTQPKVWITGNSMVINTDKYQRQVNKRFLFHYLSSYNFNSIVSGSGQPQIVRTPLEKIKVVLPTIEKQVRIANSIDIVSEKIDTESLVLRLLENQKQYLLRQMFI